MNGIQKKQLQSMMRDERFDAFLALSIELTDSWKSASAKRDTDFETVWALAYNEGKIEGLKAFFSQLELEAQ